MRMELISVVVPVYNAAEKIRKCLNSLCRQTYSSLEIIVIDDGSTDGTEEIVQRMAENDARICYIRQENTGVAVARNKGIDLAKGTYITFCDGDDFVLPTYIEKLAECQKRNNADWVISGFQKVIGKERYLFSEPYVKPVFSMKEREEFVKEWYKNSYISTVWGKLYCGEILRANKILFPERWEHGEDTVFNIRYYACCKRIDFVREPLYCYVENKQSLTSKNHKDIWEKQGEIFKEFRQMVQTGAYSGECEILFFVRGILIALNHAEENRWTSSEWERLCREIRETPYFLLCVKRKTKMDTFAHAIITQLEKRKDKSVRRVFQIKMFGYRYLRKLYYLFRR